MKREESCYIWIVVTWTILDIFKHCNSDKIKKYCIVQYSTEEYGTVK